MLVGRDAGVKCKGNGKKNIPSLNSFPEQLVVISRICSRRTISPASFAGSLSPGAFAALVGGRNISLSLGIIFSVKGLRPDGSSSIMVKMFFSITLNNSRSFISSNSAGRTFFSMTDLGKEGKTRGRPRMNADFSVGVLAGNASRNRIVEMRMLSK